MFGIHYHTLDVHFQNVLGVSLRDLRQTLGHQLTKNRVCSLDGDRYWWRCSDGVLHGLARLPHLLDDLILGVPTASLPLVRGLEGVATPAIPVGPGLRASSRAFCVLPPDARDGGIALTAVDCAA